jgi:hypothetical protein
MNLLMIWGRDDVPQSITSVAAPTCALGRDQRRVFVAHGIEHNVAQRVE